MQDKNRKIVVGDVIRWLGGIDAGYEFEITRSPRDKDDNAWGNILVYGPRNKLTNPVVIGTPYTRPHNWEFVDDELTLFVKQVRKEEGIIDG